MIDGESVMEELSFKPAGAAMAAVVAALGSGGFLPDEARAADQEAALAAERDEFMAAVAAMPALEPLGAAPIARAGDVPLAGSAQLSLPFRD